MIKRVVDTIGSVYWASALMLVAILFHVTMLCCGAIFVLPPEKKKLGILVPGLGLNALFVPAMILVALRLRKRRWFEGAFVSMLFFALGWILRTGFILIQDRVVPRLWFVFEGLNGICIFLAAVATGIALFCPSSGSES